MILLREKKINIFCFESEKKFSEEKIMNKLKELTEEYEQSLNYGYLTCPFCKSDKLIRYGNYERNIGINENYIKLKIKRVMCKKCKKTHALLPDFIKPYYQSESSFIDFTVMLKELFQYGTNDISNFCDVGRQKLLQWKKRFELHKTRVMTTLGIFDLQQVFQGIFETFFKEKYYYENHIEYFCKVPT